MMMVEKLMDQKRKYWSRAMKKGRCNLDEEPIKEVRPTVKTTPQKFSWMGSAKEITGKKENLLAYECSNTDKPRKQQEQLIAQGEPFFKRIIFDARQRSDKSTLQSR